MARRGQTVIDEEVNKNVQRVAELAQVLEDSNALLTNIAILNQEVEKLTGLANAFY